jgi:hypothetical protein
VFYKTVSKQDVINQVKPTSFCLFYVNYYILIDYTRMQYFFISHKTEQTEYLRPSPAPHFKDFQLFFIRFLNMSQANYPLNNYILITDFFPDIRFMGSNMTLNLMCTICDQL